MTTPDRLIMLQDMALQGKCEETLPDEEKIIITDIQLRIEKYMGGLNKIISDTKN